MKNNNTTSKLKRPYDIITYIYISVDYRDKHLPLPHLKSVQINMPVKIKTHKLNKNLINGIQSVRWLLYLFILGGFWVCSR